MIELSEAIHLENGKWLLPASINLKSLSCAEADVRLSEYPSLEFISASEAHLSCKTPLPSLKTLHVRSTSIRASDFEFRLKQFFKKSNANLTTLKIQFDGACLKPLKSQMNISRDISWFSKVRNEIE